MRVTPSGCLLRSCCFRNGIRPDMNSTSRPAEEPNQRRILLGASDGREVFLDLERNTADVIA